VVEIVSLCSQLCVPFHEHVIYCYVKILYVSQPMGSKKRQPSHEMPLCNIVHEEMSKIWLYAKDDISGAFIWCSMLFEIAHTINWKWKSTKQKK